MSVWNSAWRCPAHGSAGPCWPRPVRLLALALVAVSVAGSAAAAAGDEPAVEPPAVIRVGVHLNAINHLSVKENIATADFWIWCKWQGDGEKNPLNTIEIANGTITSGDGDEDDIRKEFDGGVHYACRRMTADVRQHWSLTAFPMEVQNFIMQIEDGANEEHLLQLTPDATDGLVDPDFRIHGWRINDVTLTRDSHLYPTTYGDTSIDPDKASRYSQLKLTVTLARPGWGLFIKLFAGLAAAAGLAFLSLLIRPIDLDPRFGLGVGGLFAAVASQYVISEALPDSTELSMADWLCLCSIVFIFLALIESVISLKIYYTGRESLSRRLDLTCCIVLVIAFLVCCTVIVLRSLPAAATGP